MRFRLLSVVALLLLPLTGLAEESPIRHYYGLSMFGDLKYGPNFRYFDYVNPRAPKGGEMRYGVPGSFDSLNPYILKGVAGGAPALVTDTLMLPSADEPLSQYGLVAESVEMPDDRAWITFTLRPEARWNDGTPITADDVVFSFDILKEKGHPTYRIIYAEVTKAEKLSRRKVKFTFAHNGNRELALLAGQLPLISKAYFSTHEFNKSSLLPYLSSGPYEITAVQPGKSITYKRVKNYWGRNLPVNRGRNNFDTIRYDYYRDSTVAVEAFKAGAFDIRQENIAKIWAGSYNVPAVKDGRIQKVEIPHEIPAGMQAFILNTRRPNFSNRLIRKALSYAFDFEWSNKNLFYNAYRRNDSYFENSDYASNGVPEGKELALLEPFKDQLPPELFTTPFTVPKTDGSGNIRPNLRIAYELIQEAGWKLQDGKLINPETNQPVVIEFLISQSEFERVIAPFVRNLSRLGITSKIREVDAAQYQKRMDAFDFDVVVGTFAQTSSPGNEQIDYWHSSRVNVKGSNNLAGVNDPVIDELVKKVTQAQSQEELLTATHALDRVLLFGYYVVPQWHINYHRVIYWNKFGRPTINPKYALGLDSWWYDPITAAKLKKPGKP